MKILDIAYDARMEHFDGAHIHTFSLAEHIAKHIEIDVIARSNKNKNVIIKKKGNMTLQIFPFIDIQKFNFFKKIYLIFYNNLNLSIYLIKKWRGYDMIYERHNLNMFAGNLISKFKNIPLIYEVNGIPDEDAIIMYGIQNSFLKYILRIMATIQLRFATAIIVQTKELQQIISSRYKCHNVFIVENGIEIPKKFYRKKHSSSPQFVFVGSLDTSHDPSPILNALTDTKENFTFSIIGDGVLHSNLKKQYSYDKRISFVGKTSHELALQFIARSDLCIVHYNNDYEEFRKYGFYYCPIKLLEYASFNKPVIVIGCENTIINTFKNEGACIVYKSSLDFKKEIFEILKNKRKLSLMGKKAGKVAKEYTWEKAAIKTIDVFRTSINPVKR